MAQLLKLENVCKTFEMGKQILLKAVEDISLEMDEGEMLGIVGEPGCGKSTLGKLVSGVQPPTAGSILLGGEPLGEAPDPASRRFSPGVQMLLRESEIDLFSTRPVAETMAMALEETVGCKGGALDAQVFRLLQMVQLDPARARRQPARLSEIERVRAAVGYAMCRRPRLLVCDEPVTGMETTAQLLRLLERVQKQTGVACLLFDDDPDLLVETCDRIGVICRGRMVEFGPAVRIAENPCHPYTQRLRQHSRAAADSGRLGKRVVDSGDVNNLVNPGPGCRFASRCPYADARCRAEYPPQTEVAPGHWIACWKSPCTAQE